MKYNNYLTRKKTIDKHYIDYFIANDASGYTYELFIDGNNTLLEPITKIRLIDKGKTGRLV